MRGRLHPQRSMLGFLDLEERVPPDHPLRAIKQLAAQALADGRPSIPPERLLKASLLMALYSIRSERLFCEQMDYHLLLRWFLDMDLYEPG
jgi:transposase